MCALDGDAEFVFHASLRADEEDGRWTVPQAQRIFDEAMGRHFAIEVLSLGTWTPGTRWSQPGSARVRSS